MSHPKTPPLPIRAFADVDPKMDEEQYRAVVALVQMHRRFGLLGDDRRPLHARYADLMAAAARVELNFDRMMGFWRSSKTPPPPLEEAGFGTRVVDGPRGSTTRETHESYGLVRISRVSGNPGPMFGSPLDNHGTFFDLAITRGERITDSDGSESYFGHEELISVRLTSHQFVELMTTMNMGMGVPCTIEHIGGAQMASPPAQMHELDKVEDQAEAMMTASSPELVKLLDRARKAIEETRTAKVRSPERKELASIAQQLVYALDENANYRVKVFREATQRVVSHAKQEVVGFVNKWAFDAGLRALGEKLGAQLEPKMLAAKSEPEDGQT